MQNGTLLRTGIIGSVIAAVCCATPILMIVFGAVGLSAWAAKLDYVVLPALVICLGLVGFALYRRRQVAARCEPETKAVKDA